MFSFIALVSLKMSHNEFPTRDLPEAYAPGQYRGWIQTTPIDKLITA